VSLAGLSRPARWFGAAAAIIAVDQLVKALVLARLAPGEGLEVTGFFNLVLVFNRGAAFSFLAREAGWQTPLLVGFALVASVVVAVLMVRNAAKPLLCGALATILGGALGNAIDRLRFGYVVDFLDFHAFGWHWPAFNVADSAITIGAVLLILDGLVRGEAAVSKDAKIT
jgi:signal peptidase II